MVHGQMLDTKLLLTREKLVVLITSIIFVIDPDHKDNLVRSVFNFISDYTILNIAETIHSQTAVYTLDTS